MEDIWIKNDTTKPVNYLHDGICLICGDKFKSLRKTAKYCSDYCKGVKDKRIASRKAREQRKTHNKCLICNNPVEQDRWGKIKRYCSNACKQKSYRQRKANADNLSTTLK